ncbi:MAG: ribose 5-phosphate isomerase B [Flavobacteriales bacterium]|nr:ribose 5-phosphate isomerase B [Flavobacteriales bacterium]|tara:strand:- start:1405 stop:1833 length:429 start_codon:yes stop_codon:yes gene_type:complete
MNIGLACDHAGYLHKEKTKKYLEELNYNVSDYGCFSEESVDYPDFAHKLAQSITNNINTIGIQFCGTGNGINMSANKHKEIRAALCWNTHICEQARLHNNANVLTMPARHLDWNEVKDIIDIFLNTSFEGGRHQRRVDKIST